MTNLMGNLTNVLTKAEGEIRDSQSLKTLMNTYRTLLHRIDRDDISTEDLRKFDEHKTKFEILLNKVEKEIDVHLDDKLYKMSDNYAEVSYRIAKVIGEIELILKRSKMNDLINNLHKGAQKMMDNENRK